MIIISWSLIFVFLGIGRKDKIGKKWRQELPEFYFSLTPGKCNFDLLLSFRSI
jgi:hypothetical protein